MVSNAEVSVWRSGTGCCISMRGILDQNLDPRPILAENATTIVFDLSGIERVTSFGVREWVHTLYRVRDRAIYFIDVPPTLVAQFNMVAGFGGNGRVLSLQAPFQCNECGHEQVQLVEISEVHRFAEKPSALPCEACGSSDVEFDDIPEVYFDFVAAQAPVVIPPLVRKLISGSPEPEEDRPLTVRKEITGEETLVMLSGALDESPRYHRLFAGLEGTVVTVCGAVSRATKDGIAKLLAALARTDESTYLARVPPCMAVLMSPEELEAENVTVISCIVSLQDPDQTPIHWEIGPKSVCPNLPEVADQVEIARRLVSRDVPERIQGLVSTGGSATPTASDDALVFIGRTVLDRYLIVRHVARGGMGEVFMARQHSGPRFIREVVVKRLRPEHLDSGRMVDMFVREARLASMISHPNVVTVLDFGRERDGYYLAMEYIRGWDLATVVKALRQEGRKMPETVACRLVAQICAGLHAAHNARDEYGAVREIVHRDVSPSNVLVMASGQVKITDFGIAKMVLPHEQTDPDLVKGKLAYMAPEQLEFETNVDRRADIFAAGVVLLECLTLQRPFAEGSSRAPAVVRAELETHRRETSGRLEAVVYKALAEEPEARFQTAAEMETDLEQCISDRGEAFTSTAIVEFLEALRLPPPAGSRVARPDHDHHGITVSTRPGGVA